MEVFLFKGKRGKIVMPNGKIQQSQKYKKTPEKCRINVVWTGHGVSIPAVRRLHFIIRVPEAWQEAWLGSAELQRQQVMRLGGDRRPEDGTISAVHTSARKDADEVHSTRAAKNAGEKFKEQNRVAIRIGL